jgi:hypothetical protein
MKMRTLTAIKPHKYGTRHLVAGEEYEVPPRHAIALVAGKKAKFAPDKPPVRAAPLVTESNNSIAGPATTEAEAAIGGDEDRPDIDSLRLEATQVGIDVDGRWGIARLQYEISKAKG